MLRVATYTQKHTRTYTHTRTHAHEYTLARFEIQELYVTATNLKELGVRMYAVYS